MNRPGQARCVAPLGDVPEGAELTEVALCGALATEMRIVEGVACLLCTQHAAELDAERAAD